MPRTHPGVFSRATLMAVVLALAPMTAWAEGPIARAARLYAAPAPLTIVGRGFSPASKSAQRTQTSGPRRGLGRIVAGAAVGAAGGFFAGGYLGAWIDGDCGGCDDPGLKGALIGAPIGAVAGGILGGKFLF